MEGQQHGDRLKRGLKNRHIQLIALGGAIGTGLFLGARPSFSPPARVSFWLRYRRFYRFPDHASAGRNGGGRAGGRLI